MRATATPPRDPDGLAPETAAAQVRAWRRDIAALRERLRAPLDEQAPLAPGEKNDAWIGLLRFKPGEANIYNVEPLLYVHLRASGRRVFHIHIRRKVDGLRRLVTEKLGEWPRMNLSDAREACKAARERHEHGF